MRKSLISSAVVAGMLACTAMFDLAFGQRGRSGEEETRQPSNQAQQNQFRQGAPNRQFPSEGVRTRTNFRGRAPATRSLTDWQITECLIVDNQGEIALAEQAEKSAKSDDVKKFAQKMADDHTKLLHRLEQEIGGAGNPPLGAQAAVQGRGGQRPQQGLDLVTVKRQIGEQCRRSALNELQDKQGDKFDKCFMGMQIGMHMHMLDSLRVFSRYASPELDRVIEQAENDTQSHLDRAKQIMASLEGEQETGARSARRESRNRDESSRD